MNITVFTINYFPRLTKYNDSIEQNVFRFVFRNKRFIRIDYLCTNIN